MNESWIGLCFFHAIRDGKEPFFRQFENKTNAELQIEFCVVFSVAKSPFYVLSGLFKICRIIHNCMLFGRACSMSSSGLRLMA